uniref:Uncharacterized protein n=1 Tax=Oryza sativa subsp. japonica TaxID=39947 RepID=Q6EQB7_ORYSJ|nr:hypothetical protein [Oryza sativa Japonica Group]BAD29153.1 hypothetical protein [Oryza sativa Japonica Group]
MGWDGDGVGKNGGAWGPFIGGEGLAGCSGELAASLREFTCSWLASSAGFRGGWDSDTTTLWWRGVSEVTVDGTRRCDGDGDGATRREMTRAESGNSDGTAMTRGCRRLWP